jgi:hypothetical protein
MKMLLVLFAVLLAACSTIPNADQFANASAACYQGPGWNGGQISLLYVGVDKGAAGTKGGAATIVCGSAQVGFTDSGNLSGVAVPTKQSIRVEVDPAPMKLTPK